MVHHKNSAKSFVITALLISLGLSAQPRRIVSTTPSITEVVFALGVGERLVGVSTFCHYPPAAQKVPKIGTYMKPNMEAIVASRPDLVLVENNPLGYTEKMRGLGLNVVEVNTQSARELPKAIRDIAGAVKVSPDTLLTRLDREMTAVRATWAGKKPVRVMFVVGRTPGVLDGLVVAGKGSYLHELLQAAGGDNIFQDAASSYPRVSLEEVLARRPDVIIDMGDMADTVQVTEAAKQAVVALWKKYPALPAVRNGRVFAVASDHFVVPGPRIAEAARDFARMLH